MSTRIKVEMKPVNTILTRLGVDKNGDVQKFVTNTINRRMTRYMPALTETMATKLKFIKSPTEIEVLAQYARVTYYGEIMVDPVTRAAGFLNKDGRWKSRKGVPKVRSGRQMEYTKTKHPLAGPFWDRRMMAAEKDAIAADVMAYIRRKGK